MASEDKIMGKFHVRWCQATEQTPNQPGPLPERKTACHRRQVEMVKRYKHLRAWPLMGCVDLLFGTDYQAWMCGAPKEQIDLQLLELEGIPSTEIEQPPARIMFAVTMTFSEVGPGGELEDVRTGYEKDFRYQPLINPKAFVLWASTEVPDCSISPAVIRWAKIGVLDKRTRKDTVVDRDKRILRAIAIELWKEQDLPTQQMAQHPIIEAVNDEMKPYTPRHIEDAIRDLNPKKHKGRPKKRP